MECNQVAQGRFSPMKVLYPGHEWFHRPYEVTTACYAKVVYITRVLSHYTLEQ